MQVPSITFIASVNSKNALFVFIIVSCIALCRWYSLLCDCRQLLWCLWEFCDEYLQGSYAFEGHAGVLLTFDALLYIIAKVRCSFSILALSANNPPLLQIQWRSLSKGLMWSRPFLVRSSNDNADLIDEYDEWTMHPYCGYGLLINYR